MHFKVDTWAGPWQQFGVVIEAKAGTKWQDIRIIPVVQLHKGNQNFDISHETYFCSKLNAALNASA